MNEDPPAQAPQQSVLTRDEIALELGRRDLEILALNKQLAGQFQINRELAFHLANPEASSEESKDNAIAV